MDALDEKILRQLMLDSRVPITQLAKKVAASREVVTYRINKLQTEAIILGFVTEIDSSKLGYIGAALFVNVKAKRERAFKAFIAKTDYVSWVAQLTGVWSTGLSIIGTTLEDIDSKFITIYTAFKDDIIDYRFTMHKQNRFFYEKYFGSVVQQPVEKKTQCVADEKDKRILQELAKNSRIEAVTLANTLGITAPAITKRIKHLEAAGYIQRYSLFIDISKLGLLQYSIFIQNKNIAQRKKLTSYLAVHPAVSFTAEYIGDEFVEFGIFVKDSFALRSVLQEIEESFPDNRIIEVSLFQEEFVSIGPPRCIFQ